MHLTKIIQVMIGKNTKALRHEALSEISPQCCFSVVAKKATLDLSTPSGDPIAIRTFTAYLKGMQRHFIEQQTRYAQQNPNGRSSKGRSRSKRDRRDRRDHNSRSHSRGGPERRASGDIANSRSAPPSLHHRHGDSNGHSHSGGGSENNPKGSEHRREHGREHHRDKESTPNSKGMKLSPIGQGFNGFNFDSKTVSTMANGSVPETATD